MQNQEIKSHSPNGTQIDVIAFDHALCLTAALQLQG